MTRLPGALVWDMVFPLEPWCGNDYAQLARFHAAGLHVISLTLAGDNHNIGEGIQRVAAARAHILANADRYVLVERITDVDRARKENKLAVAFHLEGTRCFERNLDIIDAYYQLGVRHTLLAFNQANDVGGGCAERADGGLSKFGEAVVRRMERVGMLLDLSHTGHRTTLDAMALATKPCVFTHSMADAVQPHFRNLKDDQIRACAKTGGVIGMSGSGEYMGDLACSNEAILRHIDHIAQLVGPQHVGLGLDLVFDADALNRWIRSRPEEWPQARDPSWPGFRYATLEQLPALTDLLLKRYSETDVRGILGENWRRVCAQVWR
ncbi:MAG TPA: membrane dipeptidase [Nevskiaceae bacterium]|nr:membrane dipeptidase [Nevskiaceae bacterium]